MIEGRPVWATIPTIGHSDLLVPLMNALDDDDVDKVILTVNLEDKVEAVRECFQFSGPNIEIIETWPLGKSIYHGWNISIEMAREANAWLAVLNDDIQLTEEKSIYQVASLLSSKSNFSIIGLNWQDAPADVKRHSSPLRVVHGSYRHYGVGGFAWVCDPNKVELVPDDLVHWGGDDFIFFRSEDAGHSIGLANYVPVEHPRPETTSASQKWTYTERAKDKKAFEAYYPGKGW